MRLGRPGGGDLQCRNARQADGSHGAAGADALAGMLVVIVAVGFRVLGSTGNDVARLVMLLALFTAGSAALFARGGRTYAEVHGAVVGSQRFSDHEGQEEAEQYGDAPAAASEGGHDGESNSGFGVRLQLWRYA